MLGTYFPWHDSLPGSLRPSFLRRVALGVGGGAGGCARDDFGSEWGTAGAQRGRMETQFYPDAGDGHGGRSADGDRGADGNDRPPSEFTAFRIGTFAAGFRSADGAFGIGGEGCGGGPRGQI